MARSLFLLLIFPLTLTDNIFTLYPMNAALPFLVTIVGALLSWLLATIYQDYRAWKQQQLKVAYFLNPATNFIGAITLNVKEKIEKFEPFRIGDDFSFDLIDNLLKDIHNLPVIDERTMLDITTDLSNIFALKDYNVPKIPKIHNETEKLRFHAFFLSKIGTLLRYHEDFSNPTFPKFLEQEHTVLAIYYKILYEILHLPLSKLHQPFIKLSESKRLLNLIRVAILIFGLYLFLHYNAWFYIQRFFLNIF